MKLTTTKEKILDAVLLVERITGKKESLPVLACILFEAQKDLTIRATNLEAGIEVSVQADIEDKGRVAVPAGILSSTLRSVSGEKVSFKLEEGNLIVSTKGTRTLIKAVPHDEFPSLTKVDDKKTITVPREEFLRGLQSVSYAASPSMIRPELGSVYIYIKEGSLLCVATDSFRLAEKKIPIGSKGEGEFLIPLKHAQELAHVLEHITAPSIEISTGDAQLSITGDGARYMSRVVEGNFPNYKEIIPKEFSTEATVLKGDAIEMLKKARVFSGTDQHVGLHVYPKRKIFTATARSADIGEMSDTIDAALSGDDLDINFHIGYVADCMQSIQSDSLTFGFSGAGRPLVIRGSSDASFLYLVMPLNR